MVRKDDKHESSFLLNALKSIELILTLYSSKAQSKTIGPQDFRTTTKHAH